MRSRRRRNRYAVPARLSLIVIQTKECGTSQVPKRSSAQQIGSAAEALVQAITEGHGAWIARQQQKDFGVDLEFELVEPDVEGLLLKVQVKGSGCVQDDDTSVRVQLETTYARLAENLRLPLIHIWVDLERGECWYLWLQRWVLEREAAGRILDNQDSVTLRLPSGQTLSAGLDDELKDVARSNTSTQLALALRDSLKTATSVGNLDLQYAMVEVLRRAGVTFPRFPVDSLLDEATRLGDALRGSVEGVTLTKTLVEWVRQHGQTLAAGQVERLVLRGESYSRTGINTLGILYDEFPSRAAELELPKLFSKSPDPRPRYYCLLREKNPGLSGVDLLDLVAHEPIEGLILDVEAMGRPFDKWANRGDAAILDYLVESANEASGDSDVSV